MFGKSKSVAFKPYALRSGRPARRVPAWLIWLILGVLLGVGSVLFIQQNYLPPRLSVAESARLTEQVAQLQRLVGSTQSQLEQATADAQRRETERAALAAELAKARVSLKPLEDDLRLLLEALPPDPRGGDVQIRSARFFNDNEALDYHLVLTGVGSAPLKGTVQFAVEGRYPGGRAGSVDLPALPLTLDKFQNITGKIPLPDSLRARQVTIRILDTAGRQQAMRVINSRN